MKNNEKFLSLIADFTYNQPYLTAEQSDKLSRCFTDKNKYIDALLNWVKEYSVSPISHFKVAALAFESEKSGGRVFFGSNLEFTNQALSLVVHGEQSALHNAYIQGATCIEELVINASPCGFCRQFINEIDKAKQPKITVSRETKNIEDYLPNAFGPEDLNNKFALFSKPVIAANTLNGCLNASYAPYSDNKAACQIVDDEGNQYFGLYIENAAYSPSLSPLQAALNQMQLHKRSLQIDTIFDNIIQIRVLETAGKANQAGVTDAVAACLPEHITVEYEQA